MGRNRNNRKDERLPKYVYKGRSAYEYSPYIAGQKRKRYRLCDLNSTTIQIWQAYEEMVGKIRAVHVDTLEALSNKYLASDIYKTKSVTTQKDYLGYHRRIMAFPTSTGMPFGQVHISDITPGTIRSYLDKRPKVGGNREVAYLSLVFSWAYERDLVNFNPAKGVRKNSEEARKTYVTQAMYDEFYNLAESPWYIRPMMEIAYLCRLRRVEILDLKKSDILKEGLQTRRTKGSKDAITLWSDRLRSAINTALNYKRKIDSVYIFADNYGQNIKEEAFTSAWGRLMKKYTGESFTFHDLKARGVSDFEGNKQDASGHKTASMVAVYDRKPKKVKATD